MKQVVHSESVHICHDILVAGGGPWGSAFDVILSLLPVFFLILVTIGIPRITLKATKSFPISALILWFIRLAYFASPPNSVNALVVSGLLEALTPLSIVLGAIILFETIKITQCLSWVIELTRAKIHRHRVAEFCVLGWCLVVTMEGSCGFGTPIGLSANLMLPLGYPIMPTLAALLITDAIVTPFGVVGTPMWFGLGNIGLTDDELRLIGRKTAIITGATAYILVPWAASFVISLDEILKSILFIFISITSIIVPYIVLAFFSIEFPTFVAGIVGLLITCLCACYGVGLCSREMDQPSNINGQPDFNNTEGVIASDGSNIFKEMNHEAAIDVNNNEPKDAAESSQTATASINRTGDVASSIPTHPFKTTNADIEVGIHRENKEGLTRHEADESGIYNWKTLLDFVRYSFPWWGTLIILAITRIPQLGVKEALQSTKHSFSLYLGTFGTFSLSPSLVFRLMEIFRTDIGWTYQMLYVPFILPLIVVSILTILIHARQLAKPWHTPFTVAIDRISTLEVALFGALALSQLFGIGGSSGASSPAFLVGQYLSAWISDGFIALSGLLGLIGSFFGGGTTVSNLMFGEVQQVAAESIGRSVTAMLSLQCTGAALGNMVCIYNVLAASAMLGIDIPIEKIIRKTWLPCIVSLVVATCISLVFLLGDIWS